jgi:site-specific recombinase XerD
MKCRAIVFVNPDIGQPYTKNINRDVWNTACKAALGYVFPLNNVGRHSLANQMLEAGIDIETVSVLLRHSNTAVTKNNYARPNLKVIGGAVDRTQGGKWPGP